LKVVYIKETENTHDVIKRILVRIKKFLNIIKVEKDNITMLYLPIFKGSKISKYRIKGLSNKINKVLEREDTSIIVLSEYLNNNQLLKNYLYSNNINILDGKFLFKCLINKVINYIFKIKNITKEIRKSYIINKWFYRYQQSNNNWYCKKYKETKCCNKSYWEMPKNRRIFI